MNILKLINNSFLSLKYLLTYKSLGALLICNLIFNFIKDTFQKVKQNKFMEILREFDPGSG